MSDISNYLLQLVFMKTTWSEIVWYFNVLIEIYLIENGQTIGRVGSISITKDRMVF